MDHAACLAAGINHRHDYSTGTFVNSLIPDGPTMKKQNANPDASRLWLSADLRRATASGTGSLLGLSIALGWLI